MQNVAVLLLSRKLDEQLFHQFLNLFLQDDEHLFVR